MTEDPKRLCFRMPLELHKKLKIYVAENDMTLQDFYIYAIRKVLNERREKEKTRSTSKK